jgi:HSP20 family protein
MNFLKKWRGNEGREEQQGTLSRAGREQRPLSRLREEMNRAFERVWKDFDRDPWTAMARAPEMLGQLSDWPAMDMAEDEKSLTIRVDVPGLEAKDVDVEVSGNQLSVRGQRQDEFKEEQKGLYRRERYSGSFARTITLPAHVDASRVEASYDKGTLTITAPKIPGQGPRRVRVKSE